MYSFGQMVENTKVDGQMENNTELEHTHRPVGRQSKGNGKKVRDLIGSQAVQINEPYLNKQL